MQKPAFRLATLGALVLAAVAGLIFLPVKTYLAVLVTQVRELGPWGPVVLGSAYVPAAVLMLPGSLLTLAAGFAFGVATGTVAVSLGSTVGAAAAFLAGRTLARPWVEDRVAANPKFQAIDQAIGEQGFKMVLLLRLSPAFPYNILNYALGLTQVSFRDYVLASWIGMLPATVMYVYIGSAVKDVAELLTGQVERGTGEKILFLVGLAATVVVTVWITRIATKALRQVVPPTGNEQHASPEGVPHA